MNLPEAFLALSSKLPVDDPSIKARLDRAYDILRFPGYELRHVSGNNWQIEKASTAALDSEPATYTISADGCSCPDAQERARAGLCKHRLAVMLHKLMNGLAEERPNDCSFCRESY